MELCGECNNWTKFQFYTGKDVRDIQFFCDFTPLCPHYDVTSHLNLHKSKS